MAVNSEAKKGFWLVIGAIAAIYIGSMIASRLPT